MAAEVLSDVLGERTVTVICGSAASTESARVGRYYAHPNNRFWRTLHEAGFTERTLAPSEYPLVRGYGLGLTDLAKRAKGPDSRLPRGAYDAAGLEAKISGLRPRFLAFNGKAPATHFLSERRGAARPGYGVQRERLGPTRIVVLPSTSGRARRWWAIEPWLELARLHREGMGP